MRYRKILGAFLISVLFSAQAFALKADFETVRNYHNQEIKQLLKDYTLEESLKIRVELKKTEASLKEQEVVNLPGIYQKTGEAASENIESVLNLYERKIVFIKKREISEKEMELVKSSLSERLFLPKDASFTVLDDTPNLNDAVSNLGNDFVFGAYGTLIKKGQFLWILIFSIGFIVALWILAKVWKSKGDGAGGGEISMSGGEGMAHEAADTSDSSNDVNSSGAMSLSNSDFETFNFMSLCQNINDAYQKAPGAASHILWTAISDLQSQIQFYEILRIQNNIPQEVLSKTYEAMDKTFAFEKRASNQKRHRQAKGFNKETLSRISVELARLKFIPAHDDLEKLYLAIYPNKADHLDLVFKEGLSEHYISLYKIYKDEFMNFVSSQNGSEVLDKINNLLTFDPETDHPSEEQYQACVQFLESLDLEQAGRAKKSVNSKVVTMIYNLSEEELLKVEAMKSNEDLKAEIPSFSWVLIEDEAKFKNFLTSLSGAELKYILDYDQKYQSSLDGLDDRTQFRIKERMTNDKSTDLNWRDFRNKIKRHYSYEGLKQNEESISKAS